MIEWIPVVGSSWVVAEAYSEEDEVIYVKFSDGTGWAYQSCPPHVWSEFTAPEQSRGKYINQVLKHKPGGKYLD